MLICEHLGKEYRGVWVLRDFNLQCGPGMLGLIGPNGAGKTTLSRILATLLPQSEGSVTWNGKDTRTQGEAIRRTLGYLPQEFGLYPELSSRQFLTYLAAMKGLPSSLAKQRVEEVLDIVNLRGAADKKLKDYSGGMKRRVGIAQALLNDPLLLVVDEPTAGLDIEERVRFRTLLSDLATDRLIILSTHIIGGNVVTDPKRTLDFQHLFSSCTFFAYLLFALSALILRESLSRETTKGTMVSLCD